MTTSTLGTSLLLEHLRPTRPSRTDRLRAACTLQRSGRLDRTDRTAERAAARAYRSRERALSRTSGNQHDELLALSRCS